MELFDLTGKNAIVIGGAGGLGQAIAQGYVEAGANVSIASRNPESLKRAQTEIEDATGARVSVYTLDASVEDDVAALADRYVSDHGAVDILVNSQGFNKKFPMLEFPMDVWDSMFDVNVKSVMLCCKHFGKHMKNAGSGKIVIVSSVRGARGTGNGNSGYCSTKGAIDMMIRAMCVELGPDVTINGIGPTVTETPMMAEMFEKDPTARERFSSKLPLKRMAMPEDCVGAAIFLASKASDFVTGQIIYPDGGLTAIG